MFNKYLILLISSLFTLYLFSMVAYPLYISNLDWNYVQSIWNTWQTFNAAMIALLASIIALTATMYSENKRRERDLLAAKALLPEALSQLIYFCKHSAGLLKKAYEKRDSPSSDPYLLYISGEFYEIPEWVGSTFQRCIAVARQSDAMYMANILAELQVIRARLMDVHEDNNRNEELLFMSGDIITHIKNIGHFVAKINILFPYARNGEPISTSEINDEMINNGLSQIDAIGFTNGIE
ncbi:hypothetical protein D3C80_1056070 [compost metagenome]